ncbi:MAG: M20/M25/M40 family metallo-hydrolase [Alteromonadaceae bacterium]|nr:M20/M25/M40 family metallo-hydrolase [Alteromonadaceae bacterium]
MIKYKNKMKQGSLTLAILAGLSLSSMPLISHATNISLDKMTTDVTYLASDKLNGRANFSADIDKAANYISQRFSDIGLKPLHGLKTYKQTFSVTNISPRVLTLSLNNKKIGDDKLAMASTMTEISWQEINQTNGVQSHVISADDKFSDKISQLNQAGGKHFVLVNTAHAKMFGRYRNYFKGGLTKLNLDHQGAIVMVLTDETKINSFNLVGKTTIAKKSLTNIVGVLPGKSKSKEIVLYSAHYDHLGVKDLDNESDGSDTGKADVIYNGADDDASGTTAIINLAEYFTDKGDNARTLMFSAFAAEEIGGFGSRYFSEQLDPKDVVAMINIEMIGKPSKFGAGTMWMTGADRSSLQSLLNAQLKADKTNMEIHTDPYPEQGLFYRSDNATLARLGVPAHSFSSTQLDKDQHYHKVSDDLASLDLNSMHKVIEALSISTQGLVDGSITPSRIDVNKVRRNGKIY